MSYGINAEEKMVELEIKRPTDGTEGIIFIKGTKENIA
jgi:hypothetical protein